jgi:hypothetical protein
MSVKIKIVPEPTRFGDRIVINPRSRVTEVPE